MKTLNLWGSLKNPIFTERAWTIWRFKGGLDEKKGVIDTPVHTMVKRRNTCQTELFELQ